MAELNREYIETPSALHRLAASDDSLVLPPSRSASPNRPRSGNGGNGTSGAPPNGVGSGSARPKPSDESWWKLKLSSTIASATDGIVTVTLGGTEHYRHGLEGEDAEELAQRVHAFLAAEVARVRARAASEPPS